MTPAELHIGSFVFVTWRDAKSQPGWLDNSDVHTLTAPAVHSAGWVVRVTKDEVVISHGWSVDDQPKKGDDAFQHTDLFVIPRAMVLDVRVPTKLRKGTLRVTQENEA